MGLGAAQGSCAFHRVQGPFPAWGRGSFFQLPAHRQERGLRHISHCRRWPWCLPAPAHSPTSVPPGFPLRERTIRRGTEPGQGDHVPECPRAAGGTAHAPCKEAPGEIQGWCPREVAPLGPPTLMGLCPLSPRRCRGRAGCSSRQQDALAATAMPHSMTRDQRSTRIPPPPPDVRCAPTALGTTFLPSCMVPLENWGSGTALSPVGHVGREVSSHSEEEPWTRTCLPLGPPAFHGTFQGQPLPLNPPNYLCFCRLLGEPKGLR